MAYGEIFPTNFTASMCCIFFRCIVYFYLFNNNYNTAFISRGQNTGNNSTKSFTFFLIIKQTIQKDV